jgi:hypothetical protein
LKIRQLGMNGVSFSWIYEVHFPRTKQLRGLRIHNLFVASGKRLLFECKFYNV